MPVQATILGDKGYVWDAEGVIWLRQKCRIVGAMTGSSAEHRQHTSAGGLPCELSLEELQLALRQGWVDLRQTASLTSISDNVASSSWCSTDFQPHSSHPITSPQLPAWLTAVRTKKAVTVPVIVMDHSKSTTRPDTDTDLRATGQADSAAGAAQQGLPLEMPINIMDDGRLAIFTDLHSMGYYITDGSKFGADYLLYPGDPLLFHAQFTVRSMEHQKPIKPALLAGSARGSHAARKHLLLATVDETATTYITMAPEGGFGTTG